MMPKDRSVPLVSPLEFTEERMKESEREIGPNGLYVALCPSGIVIGIRAFQERAKIKRLQAVVCACVGHYQSSSISIEGFKGIENFIEDDVGDTLIHMRGKAVSGSFIFSFIVENFTNIVGAFEGELIVADILDTMEKTGLPKCWILDCCGKREPFHGGTVGFTLPLPKPLPDTHGISDEEIESYIHPQIMQRLNEIRDEAEREIRKKDIKKEIKDKIIERKEEEYNRERSKKFIEIKKATHLFLKERSSKTTNEKDAISLVLSAFKTSVSETEAFWGLDDQMLSIFTCFIDKDGEIREGQTVFSKEEIQSLEIEALAAKAMKSFEGNAEEMQAKKEEPST